MAESEESSYLNVSISKMAESELRRHEISVSKAIISIWLWLKAVCSMKKWNCGASAGEAAIWQKMKVNVTLWEKVALYL
jgi:hypothetical protein